MTNVLEIVVGCDDCPAEAPSEFALYGLVDGRRLCVRHWIAAGRPWPRTVASPQEIHEAELRTRDRMQRRGGTDRYLVRSGGS